MNTHDEARYIKIINLLRTNERLAMIEMNKLSQEELLEFNRFHINIVLHEESGNYRGKVIGLSIYLENVLANLLSYYFANEVRRQLMNSIIFDRMDLQKKLNTLKTILKVNHQSLWKKESNRIKAIDKLIAFRNDMAHSVLNSTNEYESHLMDKVKKWNEENSDIQRLDEFEVGYFRDHKWVNKRIKVEQINDYIEKMKTAIDFVDELGFQLVDNYARITVKKITES